MKRRPGATNPTLEQIEAARPEELAGLSVQIAAELSRLSALQGCVAARLAQEALEASRGGEDYLLTVKDAADRLATTKDYLHRHADELPFTVRFGHRGLRFSSRGIDEFIRQQQRRG